MARNSKTVPFTNPPPAAPTTPADDFATLEQPTDPRQLSMLKFATADLRKSLVRQEQQICDDIDRILEEEDDEKGKPKFKLGINLTLDLKNNEVETVISYSIKVTEKHSHSAQADDGTRDMFSESEREGMARE